jgi:hypothetical protein
MDAAFGGTQNGSSAYMLLYRAVGAGVEGPSEHQSELVPAALKAVVEASCESRPVWPSVSRKCADDLRRGADRRRTHGGRSSKRRPSWSAR